MERIITPLLDELLSGIKPLDVELVLSGNKAPLEEPVREPEEDISPDDELLDELELLEELDDEELLPDELEEDELDEDIETVTWLVSDMAETPLIIEPPNISTTFPRTNIETPTLTGTNGTVILKL